MSRRLDLRWRDAHWFLYAALGIEVFLVAVPPYDVISTILTAASAAFVVYLILYSLIKEKVIRDAKQAEEDYLQNLIEKIPPDLMRFLDQRPDETWGRRSRPVRNQEAIDDEDQ